MYNIVDFGAVGDGVTLNTTAIQRAVDACAAGGGGTVCVPAGAFLSGPILLKSHVTFHLGNGAVLRGSRVLADYPCPFTETHGYQFYDQPASLLSAFQAEDIAITGPGVLDGQGDAWWQPLDAGTLQQRRPYLVFLLDCARVRIDGVTLRNSPSWTVLPLICRDVTISNVAVKNPWKPYHNCDGINPTSCRNVRITHCHIDTGDDGITLKTLPNHHIAARGKPDFTREHIPCENIVIADCVVEHAHGGVVIGTEILGGVRNVTVDNCIFDGTRAGIRFKRSHWLGGVIENVRVTNIVMRRVEWGIDLAAGDSAEDAREVPATAAGFPAAGASLFRNLHFSHITGDGIRIACNAVGMAAIPLRDISFSHLRMAADIGCTLRHVAGMLLEDVAITSRGPALTVDGARDLELRRVQAPAPADSLPVLQLADAHDVWIHGCTAAPGTGVFLGLVGDGNRNIVLEENRLAGAIREQAAIEAAPDWSITSHAFSGSVASRAGTSPSTWLPVSAAVQDALRHAWPRERLDRIFCVSRVEAGARSGAELPDGDRRRLYIIEAHDVREKLVITEDGQLLQRVDSPDFHAYYE